MTEWVSPKIEELDDMALPEEVFERVVISSGTKRIADFTFGEQQSLKEIVLPEGLESIGAYAFHHCGIERVVFPASLKELGVGAFMACRSLRSVLFLGEGPEIIESAAFMNCISLQELTLGKGLKVTGSEEPMDFGGAFETCENLREVVLPEGFVFLGNATFSGCKSLARIVLPKGMIALGERSLAETAIRELLVPDGVTHCFNVAPLCKQLERIAIPTSVKGLSLKAFGGKPSLRDVVLPKKFEEDFDLFFPDDAKERMKITWI